jgi:hypothetical protein
MCLMQSPSVAEQAAGAFTSGEQSARMCCREWVQERKAVLLQEEQRIAALQEQARPVGPAKPGADVRNASGDGHYGVNLRPGEGERCAPRMDLIP